MTGKVIWRKEMKMKIGGIGYIPSKVKWVIDYIIESFGEGSEGILKDSIEIYGTQDAGYEIEFKLSATGMIFELELLGKYFLISASLLECRTPVKKYFLKKEDLKIGFKETINRMKVLILNELDSVLKVKK